MAKLTATAVAIGISIAALGLAAFSSQSQDAATIVRQVCSTCHGPDGNSVESVYPRLAGQQKDYLEVQLKAFRNHQRADPLGTAYMWKHASQLSDEMIGKLADYFSRQRPSHVRSTDFRGLQAGKPIFERGLAAAGVPACATCHGKRAEGVAVIPRLADQHPEYLFKQLVWFKNQVRAEPNAAPMHATTAGLSLQQMIDVSAWASYLGGSSDF